MNKKETESVLLQTKVGADWWWYWRKGFLTSQLFYLKMQLKKQKQKVRSTGPNKLSFLRKMW